jgi:hypothetical protein
VSDIANDNGSPAWHDVLVEQVTTDESSNGQNPEPDPDPET